MSSDQHDGVYPSEETPLVTKSAEHDDTQSSVSLGKGLAISLLFGTLIFITGTNMSMMTTAQSSVAADLNAFAESSWFTSTYMIATSSITPLAGRLSQIFTTRTCILVSSIILALGLLVTGPARSLTVFLLGRVITGCGSGGLVGTVAILVLDLASKRRRGLLFGLINVGFTTGISSGAVLAGLLTSASGWRLIFWIQAPLALLIGVTLYIIIPKAPETCETGQSLMKRLGRVDYAGASTLTTSVVLLLFGLSSPQVKAPPIVWSIASFAAFLLVESRFSAEPIIPISLLKMRSVLLTCLSGLVMMVARWDVLFFTPVYGIAVREWSPATAGLLLVPTNVGFGLGGVLVGWFHIRKSESYYKSCLVSFALFALASLGLSELSIPISPIVAYMVIIFGNGLSAGALLNYTLTHVLHLTHPEAHYVVSALVQTFRGFAGSFGSAIGGGLFQRVLKKALEAGFLHHGLQDKDDLIRRLLGSPSLVKGLTGLDREVAIQSYEHAVKYVILAGFALTLIAALLQAGTGWTSPETKEAEREVQGEAEGFETFYHDT